MARRKSFGQKLVESIGEANLTQEQHKALLAVDNGSQISALLTADLDDALCPDLKKVHDMLGNRADLKINVPNVILTLRFYSCAQMMRVIEEAQQMLDGKPTKEERKEMLRLKRDAIYEFEKGVDRLQRLAVKVNHITPMEPEIDLNDLPIAPAPRSTGVAPDLD